MSYRVYVENFNVQIEAMFEEEGWTVVPSLFKAELVCLDGGADISPEIYGEANVASYTSESLDYQTFGLIYIAEKLDIPIVGICRGAQALCVHHGGSLLQHQSGHSGVVSVDVGGDTFVPMAMDHHQVCVPVEGAGFKFFVGQSGAPEIMTYGEKSHLGWQPHPEWDNKGSLHRKWFFTYLKEHCL